MKVNPFLILTSLVVVVSGCASDPGFNMLPPPLYERGSLEQPARQGIVSASATANPAVGVGRPLPAPMVNSPSQPTSL